jgi:hypothetical protein
VELDTADPRQSIGNHHVPGTAQALTRRRIAELKLSCSIWCRQTLDEIGVGLIDERRGDPEGVGYARKVLCAWVIAKKCRASKWIRDLGDLEIARGVSCSRRLRGCQFIYPSIAGRDQERRVR